ncbi:MAG: hypothetical protein EXR54_01160 [Dehalococcoidia bacterium]|nr:hypothetical protein [Dehalococcoidia bacterium]
MTKVVRYELILISALHFLLVVAFILHWPVADILWPFPGATPLTFSFVASILAFAAALTLWSAASKNYGALTGMGLFYVTVFASVSIFAFQLIGSGSIPNLTPFRIACVLGTLLGIGLILWGIRFPLDRKVAMPSVVRWSFLGFALVLTIASALLILKVPNVIPWKITPEISVIIGLVYFGSAAHFAYGLLRPS